MSSINIEYIGRVSLSPKQMAELFWSMDSSEQGLFFDELAVLVMSTPAPYTRNIGSMAGLDYQMYEASQRATPLGRDAMSRISENGTQILNPKWKSQP